MVRVPLAVAASAVLLCSAQAWAGTLGEPSRVRIVLGSAPPRDRVVAAVHALDAPNPQAVAIVTRDVVRPVVNAEPAAVAVEQPRRIELRLGGATIHIDADADYEHQGPGPVDPTSLLVRAQGQWRSLMGNRAYIVWGDVQRQAAASALPRPRAIVPRPAGEHPGAEPDDMPSVPAPSTDKPQQVARLSAP